MKTETGPKNLNANADNIIFSASHDSKLWKRYIISDVKYGNLSAM